MMDIGKEIKQRRVKLGLTQEELAARTELSKGFISQLERNLTSPSIATLVDILEALGTDLSSFFAEQAEEKIVFKAEDMFVKEEVDEGRTVCWLVPNAQKNALEPIMITLEEGGESFEDEPHEGEEFGYVISGNVTLVLGDNKYKVKHGDSFCFKPNCMHKLINSGKRPAKVIWVSTPPSF
ncbi:MAG: cupin domain-containing protein [Clostridia bacterium]|nr:cupin domain-containing protein [Clostridia bacterium]